MKKLPELADAAAFFRTRLFCACAPSKQSCPKVFKSDPLSAVHVIVINLAGLHRTQGLLFPKLPERRDSGRAHDGRVAVEELNQRWCSDRFEIACDNSDVVTGVFMKDGCDREIIAWRAWIRRGLPGEPVRDMMIEAVEACFGSTDERTITFEFLSENGSFFRATKTHALARNLSIKPLHTRVNSPKSNGSAWWSP